MALTPQQLDEIAKDFEDGWSEERLDKAEFSWGPGVQQLLPKYIADQLTQRAKKENTSELHVIEKALRNYLQPAMQ